MKEVLNKILLFTGIALLAFSLHYKNLNDFPTNTHAWAQSDRLALAQGFIDNDFNLLKPQTMVYNRQFPDEWKKSYLNTTTSVDFPVHDFIPALLMEVVGSKDPIIFRMYIFLYGIIGIFFIFKIAYLISKSYTSSVYVALFFLLTPVFSYYVNGFLPTIPSLTNALIACFFYLKHLQNEKLNAFMTAMVFATLAALSRTTFAILIIVIATQQFSMFLKGRTKFFPKAVFVLLSLAFVGAYFWYNSTLRKEYGSIFLNSIMPPKNFQDFKEIVKAALENFKYVYLSLGQYIILILLFLTFIYLKFKGNLKLNFYHYPLLGFSALYCFGSLLFSILMLQQFRVHDYYFLDVFFLPIILFVVFIIGAIPRPIKPKWNVFLKLFALLGFLLCYYQTSIFLQERRIVQPWDKVSQTVLNFENAASFLAESGVEPEAKILVLDAVAPNIPFLLMERKGYAVMRPTRSNIIHAFEWDFDYLVFQNEFFYQEIYPDFPEIIHYFNLIADNGKITVCKLRKHFQKTSLSTFLELEKRNLVFSDTVDFESVPDVHWQNFNPIFDSLKGVHFGQIAESDLYGLTYKNNFRFWSNDKSIIKLNAKFLSLLEADIEIVISLNDGVETSFYKAVNLTQYLEAGHKWQKSEMIFFIPKIEQKNPELSIFLHNPKGNTLQYDDFVVQIYQ